MKALKGNKEYTIKEEQKTTYLDAGYDILDDEGNVLEYGRGRTVAFEEYMRVVKERDGLKKAKETEPENTSADRAEGVKPSAKQKPGKSGE